MKPIVWLALAGGFSALLAGFAFCLAAVLRLPDAGHEKRLRRVRKRAQGEGAVGRSGTLLRLFSKIPVPLSFERTLSRDLALAGRNETAVSYVAGVALRVLPLALAGLFLLFLSPFIGAFVLFGAVLVAVILLRAPMKRAGVMREEIEAELPWFLGVVERVMASGSGVPEALSHYRRGATGPLRDQVEKTLSDLRGQSEEAAYLSLDARVGSPMLSEVVRCLCARSRGDDVRTYLEVLRLRLSDARRQNLRTRALRLPGRVRRVSLALLVCFLLTYLCVIGQVLLTSLGGLFG